MGRSAIALARDASPRLFLATAASQLALAVLLGVQILLGRLALEAILDADRTDGELADAILPLAGVVVAQGMAAIVSAVQTQAQRLLGERVQRQTLDSITEVTASVDLERFESPEFFDDLQRVQAGALTRPLTLATGLVNLLGGLLGAVGLSIAIVAIEPVLLLVLAAAAIPLTVLARISGQLEFDFTVRQSPGARLRQYLVLTLTGRAEAAELRAFGVAQQLKDRWSTDFDRYYADLRGHVWRRLRAAVLSAVVTVVVTVAAFALLVSFVLSDRLSLASAGAAVFAIRLLTTRIQQIFSGVGSLLESSLFLEDLDRFLRLAAPPAPQAAGPIAEPLAELVLDDVRFAYPGSEQPALRGVSLRIAAGEVVALVGENGSGKTTLAKVAAGLFRPTGGEVRWNGAPVHPSGAAAVRRRVGVIFQDFVRYQLSARDNIAFGNPLEAPDGGIERAAERAGVDGVLERLPDGYDTNLGKTFAGGVDLSGGQWQRVALARAYYRSADLLILDEPTAALDARAEHALFTSVQELAAGRAVLMISHRFSTVRDADRIYVLTDGRVTESGDHESLMRHGGQYAELFELQARSYR